MTNHPICYFLKILEKFDCVELKDGKRYKLQDHELFENDNGNWQTSKISFNDLLSDFSSFSSEDLRSMLSNAQGGKEAQEWRAEVLSRRGRILNI